VTDRGGETVDLEGSAEDDLEGGSAPTFDTARFREVLGHFPTGVAVVTTADDEGPTGFTCQAFHALSLEPALVVFAPSRTSQSWPRIERTGVFCANILSDTQEALSRVFATKSQRKFDGVGWRPGTTGSPILDGALAWVDCRLEVAHDGGDHLVAIGRVLEMGVGQGHPLVFYRGGFGRFES
jgi:3-hydroxy-9,10-secoandrosta-1,3,5(10)-triene-9,17-dione monooxygenase reductase component